MSRLFWLELSLSGYYYLFFLKNLDIVSRVHLKIHINVRVHILVFFLIMVVITLSMQLFSYFLVVIKTINEQILVLMWMNCKTIIYFCCSVFCYHYKYNITSHIFLLYLGSLDYCKLTVSINNSDNKFSIIFLISYF